MTPENAAALKKIFTDQGKKFKIIEDGNIEEVKSLLNDTSPYVRMIALERMNAPVKQVISQTQIPQQSRDRYVGSISKGWSTDNLYKVWKLAKYNGGLALEWYDLDTVVAWALKRGFRKGKDTLQVSQKKVQLGPKNCIIRPKFQRL